MTARLDAKFAKLKTESRKALITFTMAFDPNRDASVAMLKALPAAGADVVELGIPFSDPMADGPIIQAAGLRALESGGTLKGVLDIVREFRKTDAETPVILMGYFNPIFRYGCEKFVKDALDAGADGAIIVDLPLEERNELVSHCASGHNAGFALVPLLAPTSPDTRIASLMDGSKGFAYYIAVAGITGQKSADLSELSGKVASLKKQVKIPLAVGFGVNIQAANHVVHFTRTWNPAKEDQATDRAYRGSCRGPGWVPGPEQAAG